MQWGIQVTGPLGGRPYNSALTSKSGRHSNGSNFVLADGHVKWLLGSAVSSGGVPWANTAGGTTAAQDCQQDACQWMGPHGSSGNAAGTNALGNNNSFKVTFSPL